MKVLVATEKPFAKVAVDGIRKEIEAAGYELALLEKYTDKAQLLDAVKDADAIIIRSDIIDAEVLDAAKELKIVVRAGAGYDNVDLAAATAHNVCVMNTPGQNSNAVAELALGMMVYAVRNFYNGTSGTELMGKKLGIIGLGAIGAMVANAASALGMEVYGYDPYISIDAAWNLSRTIKHIKSLDEIYSQCDYITIHVPLLDSTKQMINKEALDKMKDGVVLLNFARDLLVDEDALIEALDSGKVKKYVTDFANHTVAGHKGILVTPHLGASTEESEENCAVMAVKEVRDFLENGNIKNLSLIHISEPTRPY